jgi:hypothetical protein
MPIRPENISRYPSDWKQISKRVREDADQRCEWCRAPNGETICRARDGNTYMLERGETFDAKTGEFVGLTRGSEYDGRLVRVVLTVAHLDHQPENCSRDNLRALCQKCHNRYDAPMRAKGLSDRRRQESAVADMFDKMEQS